MGYFDGDPHVEWSEANDANADGESVAQQEIQLDSFVDSLEWTVDDGQINCDHE
jgi:hypothetical protein